MIDREFLDESKPDWKVKERYKSRGIKCPKCNVDLLQLTTAALLSLPARFNLICPNCNHKDYIFIH